MKLSNFDRRVTILAAIASGWGFTVGARMIYPVLLPHLREAYGLDLYTSGALLTVLFFAYAVGQLPGGVLADRIGENTTLVASISLVAGAVILIVTAGSTPVLVVSTAIFGFGGGLYAIARFTALSTVFPDSLGKAVGITNSSSEIGQSVLPALAGVIAVSLGWEFGLGFIVPPLVVIAIALRLTVPERESSAANAVESLSLDTARYVYSGMHDRTIIHGTVVFLLGVSIWQGFTGFYPTYLHEVKGLSTTVAGIVFGLYFALAAFIHPLSGAIYDRWGLRQTFLVVTISIVGFVALTIVEGVWSLVAVTLSLSFFIAFGTALESYLVELLPEDIEGTGFGMIRSVSFATGAFSPVVFGFVADRGYFDELFLVLAGLTAVMILLAMGLPESKAEKQAPGTEPGDEVN